MQEGAELLLLSKLCLHFISYRYVDPLLSPLLCITVLGVLVVHLITDWIVCGMKFSLPHLRPSGKCHPAEIMHFQAFIVTSSTPG